MTEILLSRALKLLLALPAVVVVGAAGWGGAYLTANAAWEQLVFDAFDREVDCDHETARLFDRLMKHAPPAFAGRARATGCGSRR